MSELNRTSSVMYQLTINNPKLEDFNDIHSADNIHDRIKNILIHLCALYFCYGVEKGEKGTQHIHIFTHFGRPSSCFEKLKKYFPTSHIEICKGNAEQNISYVSKDCKNKVSEDNVEITDGNFFEFGVRPKNSYNNIRYSNDLLIDKINSIEIKLDGLINIIQSKSNVEITAK